MVHVCGNCVVLVHALFILTCVYVTDVILYFPLYLRLFTVAVPCTSSSASSTDPQPHPPTLPGESLICY